MSSSFLSTNIANEFLPIFYGLFRIFKGFKINIIFDPEKDITSWGSISVNYIANISFEIDDMGNYQYDINHEMKHYGMTPKIEETYKWERQNSHGDMSFKDTFNNNGNIYKWLTKDSLVKETIHEQFRSKSKKISIATGPILRNLI
jgi:hypothetical protein